LKARVRYVLQQQMRFDRSVHRFNHERPQKALDKATPASRHQASARGYRDLGDLDYPFHEWTAIVARRGESATSGTPHCIMVADGRS
jgi:hypothetical protein